MSLTKNLCVVAVLLASALAVSGCGLMKGSEYPTQDITFIVPYAPGGTTDPVSRMLAQESEPLLKKKVVVVNKPGASATLGTAEIVQAKPDGYTIGLSSASAVAVQPQVSKLPYNGPEDYQPILNLVEIPHVLAVQAESPYKTLQDFIDAAKQKPGELRVSVSGQMTAEDMTVHYFEKVTGIKVTHVPFTGGGGEAITALLGGHVQACSTYAGTVKSHVDAGKLRVLTVQQGDRLPMFPEVPASKEAGIKIATPGALYFTMGPKGMDKAVVDKLVKTFTEAVKGANFQKFAKDNAEVVDPVGPEELTKRIKDWFNVYGTLIRDLNLVEKK